MASKEHAIVEITPEVLLKAYACGIFPMAESADDPALYWIEPEARGIIPLAGFRVPGRLARTVRSDAFTVVANRDFDAVLEGCAEATAGSIAAFTTSVIATPSRSTTATCWSAGSTASAWDRRSSAKACSTAPATPPRWRSCI
jgi:leucyl/phenylalanyl-tRNA--protein transferase